MPAEQSPVRGGHDATPHLRDRHHGDDVFPDGHSSQLHLDADIVCRGHGSVEGRLIEWATGDRSIIADAEDDQAAVRHCHGRHGLRQTVGTELEVELFVFDASDYVPESVVRCLIGEITQGGDSHGCQDSTILMR